MRRTWLPFVTTALALCLIAGCAASRRAGADLGIDRSMLTQEQITATHFANAYDVVQALRSNWLHVRGKDSFRTPSELHVYVDGLHFGDVSTLRTIAAPTIEYIRFFSGIDASSRWGLDRGAGVIFIATRSARP